MSSAESFGIPRELSRAMLSGIPPRIAALPALAQAEAERRLLVDAVDGVEAVELLGQDVGLGDAVEVGVGLDDVAPADAVLRDEMSKNGYEKNLAQFFCVLPDVKTVGVMGDPRTYDNLVAIRAVTTDDFMTADWARIPYDILAKVSNRITNECAGINRVVYDITSKPPGTVEWE